MKRNVLIFGSIAGFIVTLMMIISTAVCYNKTEYDFDGSMIFGYATMILAFSFVFIGIKNYRDKYLNGTITFGTAFKTGFFICLIASTTYVAVWLVEYYVFIPDFMEKYSALMLKDAKAKMSAADYQQKVDEIAMYSKWYKNPLFVILLTYMEILPIGLVVCVISAWILKKRS